jgi:hypothetical protein
MGFEFSLKIYIPAHAEIFDCLDGESSNGFEMAFRPTLRCATLRVSNVLLDSSVARGLG